MNHSVGDHVVFHRSIGSRGAPMHWQSPRIQRSNSWYSHRSILSTKIFFYDLTPIVSYLAMFHYKWHRRSQGRNYICRWSILLARKLLRSHTSYCCKDQPWLAKKEKKHLDEQNHWRHYPMDMAWRYWRWSTHRYCPDHNNILAELDLQRRMYRHGWHPGDIRCFRRYLLRKSNSSERFFTLTSRWSYGIGHYRLLARGDKQRQRSVLCETCW